MTTKQRVFETAFIGKCRACKKVTRVAGTATTFSDSRGVYRMDFVSSTGAAEIAISGKRANVCECGKRGAVTQIQAVTNDTPCDARCTGATGHQCECSCGGKNHGVEA